MKCAFCSKAFLNISYLQAHMARRHGAGAQSFVGDKNNEIISQMSREIEELKERLKKSERELANETRMSQLNQQLVDNSHNKSGDNEKLKAQIDNWKQEVNRQHNDELKRMKDSFSRTIHDLKEKNNTFESIIKGLQEKMGKQSHVGELKDDVELKKDSFIEQAKELDLLRLQNTEYKAQNEELRAMLKSKESDFKRRLHSREERIKNLNEALTTQKPHEEVREAPVQPVVVDTKTDARHLQQVPPPVTPRQQQPAAQIKSRSPSPNKMLVDDSKYIYLYEYCPMTLDKVKANGNFLRPFKSEVLKAYDDELDSMGIKKSEKRLSDNDYIHCMNELKILRKEFSNDLPSFNECRNLVDELADKYARQRKSSQQNRVKFKTDEQQQQQQQQRLSNRYNDSSMEQANESNRRSYSEEDDESFRTDSSQLYNKDGDESRSFTVNDSMETKRPSKSPVKPTAAAVVSSSAPTIAALAAGTKLTQPRQVVATGSNRQLNASDSFNYDDYDDEYSEYRESPRGEQQIKQIDDKQRYVSPRRIMSASANSRNQPATKSNNNNNEKAALNGSYDEYSMTSLTSDLQDDEYGNKNAKSKK